MSEFVESCRREWQRLRVPDEVADEMARELEADLAEAEAEGASAADVLGTSALDPRTFAASWAVERGLVDPRAKRGAGPRWALPAFAALAALVLIGAAAAILAWGSDVGSERLLVVPPPSQPTAGPIVASLDVNPDVVRGMPELVRVTPDGVWVGPVAFPALQEPGLGIERQVAWTLLCLGLALLTATAVLLWASRLRGRPPAATA